MKLTQDIIIKGVTLHVSYHIEGMDLPETETDEAEASEPVVDEIKVFDSDENIAWILAETVREDIQEQLQRLWRGQ